MIRDESAENLTAQFEGRWCHEPYPYGAPGLPNPHFNLESWATLPWGRDIWEE